MDLYTREAYTKKLIDDPQSAVWEMVDEPNKIAINLLYRTNRAYKQGFIQKDIKLNELYKGTTLLHYAFQCGKLDLLPELFKLGLDPTLRDMHGHSIVDLSLSMSLLFKDVNAQKQYVEKLYDMLFKLKKFKIDNFKNAEGNTPLMCFMRMAIELDIQWFKEIVDLLTHYGADIDTTNNKGNTLLHTLAATVIVGSNNQVYPADSNKLTQLTQAACFLMNQRKAEANKTNRYGLFTWEIAAVLGYTQLESKLFEQGGRLKSHSYVYQFISAISKYDNASFKFKYDCIQNPIDILHLLVSYNIDIALIKSYLKTHRSNINKDINAKWSARPEGYTPLHVAVWESYFDVIPVLLKNDANINLTDNEGRTILHHLAQCSFLARKPTDKVRKYYIDQYIDCIQKLTEQRKIKLNLQDRKGNTALHYLVTDGFIYLSHAIVIHAISLFLSCDSINVNIQNNIGETMIHHVTRGGAWGKKITNDGYLELIEHLISRNANFNLQDKEGNTPLHYLVMEGFHALGEKEIVVRITSLLLARGNIDIYIRNKKNETPSDRLSKLNISNNDSLKTIKKQLLSQLEMHHTNENTQAPYVYKSRTQR